MRTMKPNTHVGGRALVAHGQFLNPGIFFMFGEDGDEIDVLSSMPGW